MKKSVTIILILSFLLSVSAIGNVYMLILNNENKAKIIAKTSEIESLEITKKINVITIGSFYEKIKNNEEMIIFANDFDCNSCNNFGEKFIEYLNELDEQKKEMIYFMDVTNFNNEKIISKFKQDNNISNTPVVLYFRDGILVQKIEWSSEKGIKMTDVKEMILSISD